MKNRLNDFAKQYNVDLHLLGIRSDRIELMKMCDIFILPLLQEGLPVALMEVLAIRTLCMLGNIRWSMNIIDEIFIYKNGLFLIVYIIFCW